MWGTDSDADSVRLKPRGVAAGDEDPSLSYESVLVDRYNRVKKDVSRLFKRSSDRDSADPQGGSCSSPGTNTDVCLDINEEDMMSILIYYAHKDEMIGYVQGMCDILSVFMHVFPSGHLACRAFENFMGIFGRTNFSRDQSGITEQLSLFSLMIQFFDNTFFSLLTNIGSKDLFFCFRWILVYFKREFGSREIPRVWDAILSCPLTRHYHLFVALAIVNKYRSTCAIVCKQSDDIFRFFSNLRMRLDAQDILSRSEALMQAFVIKYVGEAYPIIKQNKRHAELLESITSFAIDTSTPDPTSPLSTPETGFLWIDSLVQASLSIYSQLERSSLSESELLELLRIFTTESPLDDKSDAKTSSSSPRD